MFLGKLYYEAEQGYLSLADGQMILQARRITHSEWTEADTYWSIVRLKDGEWKELGTVRTLPEAATLIVCLAYEEKSIPVGKFISAK